MFLAGREIAGLRQRLVAQATERTTIGRARRRAAAASSSALDTSVLAAEAELTARGDTDLGDEMVRVEHLRERARGIAAVIVERRRSMERDSQQLMDAGVVANLEADAMRLRTDLDTVRAEMAALGPAAEALEDDEAAFAARGEASANLSDAAVPSNAAASAAAEARGELRTLQAGVARVEGEVRKLGQRAVSLRERAERLDEQIAASRSGSTQGRGSRPISSPSWSPPRPAADGAGAPGGGCGGPAGRGRRPRPLAVARRGVAPGVGGCPGQGRC